VPSGSGRNAMPVDDETPFQPHRILEALTRNRVEFVTIGGWAANIHGSPFPTDDIDITPKADRDNFVRLSAALKELGARIYTVSEPEELPFDHDADSLAASSAWNLTTPYGRFDVSFVPNGTHGFDDLVRDATDFAVDDHVIVRIASLADIVRSKEAAGRDKDRRVLPALREILAAQSEQRRARKGRRTES
jgi:hypothetical protein